MKTATTRGLSEFGLLRKRSDCRLTAHSFSDDIIEAAWDAGIGVHALIWVCSVQC